MSAVARKWLSRQTVQDVTLDAVLNVLARAADTDGVCVLHQANIAKQANRRERATRNALNLLEAFTVIKRETRGAWKRVGRASDAILLSLHLDFTITKQAIIAARNAGSPSADLPARDAASPSASYIMKNIYGSDGAEMHRCAGRVWWDSSRENWRAQLTLDKADLDLGRHETKDLAEAEIQAAIADVQHAASHRVGDPRKPSLNPDLADLQGETLGSFLIGNHFFNGDERHLRKRRAS